MTVTVSQLNHLSIQVSNGNLLISPVPAIYAGPASFTLRVADPSGFYDRMVDIPLNVLQTAPFGIHKLDLNIPADYQLLQNYPNPFNPVTRIRFAIPAGENIRLLLYNPLGQAVRRAGGGSFFARMVPGGSGHESLSRAVFISIPWKPTVSGR